jgi:uncharacterized C2H2 Zn-finger protein
MRRSRIHAAASQDPERGDHQRPSFPVTQNPIRLLLSRFPSGKSSEMFTYSSSDVLLGRIHGTLDSGPQRTVPNLVKPRQSRSLWRCPRCGALFVSRNLPHSCGRYTVKGFLRGKPKRGVELFRVFLKEYRKIGPIILHPLKTRIALMVDIRFCS